MTGQVIKITRSEKDNRIAIVTLAREERRNSMSRELVNLSIDWFAEAACDNQIRAIVIQGAGRGFCAGSDLAELAAMNVTERSAFEEASGRLARSIAAHPKPVLAAVHGFAIGGGLTLAAACDVVVTSPHAKWSLPEVPIGLFPAWGLNAVRQRVGRIVAQRLSFGIDMWDGTAAVAAGLADHLSDNPLDEALVISAKLADLPIRQTSAVKAYFSQERFGATADAEANALFLESAATAEAAASFKKYGQSKA